jgi:hypothetical protein
MEIRNNIKSNVLDQISDRDIFIFIIGNKLENETADVIADNFLDACNSTNKTRWAFSPNINFSVIVYPTPEGDIYGYYFDSHRDHRKLIESISNDFHYQNQGDKPNNISDEEWSFRRQKWDELVDYKFSDSGFKYTFVSSDDIDIWDIQDRIKDILEKIKRDKKIEDTLG